MNAPNNQTLRLQDNLGYYFQKEELLKQALTHKSFAYETQCNSHNESLEFLGDAILGFLVTDYIYKYFPNLTEGSQSKIKAFLVSAETLSTLATALQIPEFLRLGHGTEKTGGRQNDALAANALEAVIAAIYLDQGIEFANNFLTPLYKPLLQQIKESPALVEDPKMALQEFLHTRNLPPPKYLLKAESGPDHRKVFQVDLKIGPRKIASGSGTAKKRAEVLAAQKALSVLFKEYEIEDLK